MKKINKNLEKILLSVKLGISTPRVALIQIITEISSQELSSNIDYVLSHKKISQEISPNPFPGSLTEIFSKKISLVSGLQSNLIVYLAYLRKYSSEISRFEFLKTEFENKLFSNDLKSCSSILDIVKSEFGYSIWYVNSYLILNQHEKIMIDSQIERLISDSERTEITLLLVLISYINLKSQDVALKGAIQKQIDDYFKDESFASVRNYIYAKLISQPFVSASQCELMMLFDSRSSLIDLYESILVTLKCIIATKEVDVNSNLTVKYEVKKLFSKIKSRSSEFILRSFGVEKELIDTEENKKLSCLIENYTAGRYNDSVNESLEYLKLHPCDIQVVDLLTKSAVKAGYSLGLSDSLLKIICSSLCNIYKKNEFTFRDASSLLGIAFQHSGLSWSVPLNLLVVKLLSQPADNYPDINERFYLSYSALSTPKSLGFFEANIRQKFIYDAIKHGLYSSTLILLNSYSGNTTTGNDASEFPIAASVKESRLKTYNAYHFAKSGRWADAIHEIESIRDFDTPVDELYMKCYLSHCYLKMGDIKKSLEIAVATYLDNEEIVRNLPIDSLLNSLEDSIHWPNIIELPMFFEICCSAFSEESRASLRVSFENYHVSNGISKPEDLNSQEILLRNKIAYLDKVWSPKTMQQTMLYEGTRHIEEERVRVCQLLTELDAENSIKYEIEIKDRVKNLEINKALKLIESSKVHVDIDAIKRNLILKLGNSYEKYKSYLDESSNRASIELTHRINKLIEDINDGFKNNEKKFMLLGGSTGEVSSAFFMIGREIISEFLVGEHGLNSYLSTQIRHGTINNTLRKSVEDENLISSFDESKNSYKENSYWLERCNHLSEPEKMLLSNLFAKFSSDYDDLISHVKNDLLQINWVSSADRPDKKDALFVYRISMQEMQSMQSNTINSESLNDIVDRFIEFLWKKTDENLKTARTVIGVNVKEKFSDIFDALTNGIETINTNNAMQEIHNAIASSRSSLELRIAEVVGWFHRNEVYERQDYELEFPAQIARKMLLNTKSKLSEDFNIEIIRDMEDLKIIMPGRGLDDFVYIFYELFENALKRSNLPPSQINLKVFLSVKNGNINLRVTNSVNKQLITQKEIDRIEDSKLQLSNGISKRIQEEGGTGFLKISKALKSSIYRNQEISFDLGKKKDNFFVNITFGVS